MTWRLHKTTRRAKGMLTRAVCYTLGVGIAAGLRGSADGAFDVWYGVMTALALVYFDPPEIETTNTYRPEESA